MPVRGLCYELFASCQHSRALHRSRRLQGYRFIFRLHRIVSSLSWHGFVLTIFLVVAFGGSAPSHIVYASYAAARWHLARFLLLHLRGNAWLRSMTSQSSDSSTSNGKNFHGMFGYLFVDPVVRSGASCGLFTSLSTEANIEIGCNWCK